MKHYITHTHIENATINIQHTTTRDRVRSEHDRMTCIVESMLTRLNVTHDDDVDDTIRACVDACERIVRANHVVTKI